jgi:hypothetical protein
MKLKVEEFMVVPPKKNWEWVMSGRTPSSRIPTDVGLLKKSTKKKKGDGAGSLDQRRVIAVAAFRPKLAKE